VSPDAAEWLGFATADLRAAKLLITDTGVPFSYRVFSCTTSS
jgi:hypothetical protein